MFSSHLSALYKYASHVLSPVMLSMCCRRRHFQELSLKPDLYFMEWAMTLFCKRLKLGKKSNACAVLRLFCFAVVGAGTHAKF